MERWYFLLFWKYWNTRSNIGWIRTITYLIMSQNPAILCINEFHKHELNWFFCQESYSIKWRKSMIVQYVEPPLFRPHPLPQNKSEFQTNHVPVFSDTKRKVTVCYITIKKTKWKFNPTAVHCKKYIFTVVKVRNASEDDMIKSFMKGDLIWCKLCNLLVKVFLFWVIDNPLVIFVDSCCSIFSY